MFQRATNHTALSALRMHIVHPPVTLPALVVPFSLKTATQALSAPFQVGHPKAPAVHSGTKTCLANRPESQPIVLTLST
jgi:hypothetical protein